MKQSSCQTCSGSVQVVFSAMLRRPLVHSLEDSGAGALPSKPKDFRLNANSAEWPVAGQGVRRPSKESLTSPPFAVRRSPGLGLSGQAERRSSNSHYSAVTLRRSGHSLTRWSDTLPPGPSALLLGARRFQSHRLPVPAMLDKAKLSRPARHLSNQAPFDGNKSLPKNRAARTETRATQILDASSY